jgi:hypothetical protein
MSQLEDLLFSAYEHGKREVMLQEVSNLKKVPEWNKRSLEDIYEEAYRLAMKT